MKTIMNTKFKLLKNQKGMTLIELLAVIVILGVISAIAIPSISGVIGTSKTKADAQSETLLQQAAVLYANNEEIDTSITSVLVATLLSSGYIQNTPQKQNQTTPAAYVSVVLTYTSASGWTAGAVT